MHILLYHKTIFFKSIIKNYEGYFWQLIFKVNKKVYFVYQSDSKRSFYVQNGYSVIPQTQIINAIWISLLTFLL